MATVNDPTSGVGVKVSALGSMLVTTGDDGFPTYYTKIYHPRLTSQISVNSTLWALRAPNNTNMVLRGGQIKIQIDVTLGSMVEIGVALVRFEGADPTGGSLLAASNMRLADPAPQINVIRAASATSALSMTGATPDPVTSALFHLTVPGVAGSQAILDLKDWSGFEMRPGEGVALVAASAAPVGLSTSGWFQFSEVSV